MLSRGGAVVGGLAAQLNWDWLYIEVLGVPEDLRGQGLGRMLVERAEQQAMKEGYRGAWVDTYSFQSPGFYEKNGYQRFGELRNYPGTESRIFLRKLF